LLRHDVLSANDIRHRRRRAVCISAALLALGLTAAHVGHAAGAPAFAAPEQVIPMHPGTGVLRVVIALLLVLGAVIVAGRLANRVRGTGSGSNQTLQVLAQLPLSPRERAVLIRVGERQLLLGVAPGNVRTLHVFDDPLNTTGSGPAPAAVPAEPPSFKSLLLKSLGR
jgi:flagellar protein FliO/FliZ